MKSQRILMFALYCLPTISFAWNFRNPLMENKEFLSSYETLGLSLRSFMILRPGTWVAVWVQVIELFDDVPLGVRTSSLLVEPGYDEGSGRKMVPTHVILSIVVLLHAVKKSIDYNTVSITPSRKEKVYFVWVDHRPCLTSDTYFAFIFS